MSEDRTNLPWWNADGIDEPGEDIPELTDEMLARADVYHKGKLVRKKEDPFRRIRKSPSASGWIEILSNTLKLPVKDGKRV